MAKIDTSTIEGYADMTAEQKLAAIEALELSDPDYSGYVKKDTFDAKAREAAELSRQLKAKMTETERADAERQAESESVRQELEALRRDKTVSTYKASYLALGYDEALAAATAEAITDGKMDVVFANQKKALEAQKQALKKEILEGTDRPPAGDPGGANDYSKQIEAAQAAGDVSAAAYYTRLAGVQSAQENKT